VASFLAADVSADTYVNLMDQYHPCYRADRYAPLDRPLSPEEYAQAFAEARRAGLQRFDRPRRWCGTGMEEHNVGMARPAGPDPDPHPRYRYRQAKAWSAGRGGR